MTIPGFTHPVTDQYVQTISILCVYTTWRSCVQQDTLTRLSYLEDVIRDLNFIAKPSRFSPRQTEEQKAALRADVTKLNLDPKSAQSLEILEAGNQIDYTLVAAVVKHIVDNADTPNGAILIFMPGVMEIRQCVSELESVSLGNVAILPLHANLSSEDQRRVFLPTKPRRKIVVATNVAETSVTIPDVVYVVDGGRVKETQYDAESGLQRLVEDWTSRASGRQRRGRAGRTQPGQVRRNSAGCTNRSRRAGRTLIADCGSLIRRLCRSATSCSLAEQSRTGCATSRYRKSCAHRWRRSSSKSKRWTKTLMSARSSGELGSPSSGN